MSFLLFLPLILLLLFLTRWLPGWLGRGMLTKNFFYANRDKMEEIWKSINPERLPGPDSD